MYKAIDLCVDKLEKQLRRGKYTYSDKKKGKEVERESIISKHRVLDADRNYN
jgi:ribosome-associated translation inhibitor RaiA